MGHWIKKKEWPFERLSSNTIPQEDHYILYSQYTQTLHPKRIIAYSIQHILKQRIQRGPPHTRFKISSHTISQNIITYYNIISSHIVSNGDHYILDSTYPQTSYPKRATTYHVQDLLAHHIQKESSRTISKNLLTHRIQIRSLHISFKICSNMVGSAVALFSLVVAMCTLDATLAVYVRGPPHTRFKISWHTICKKTSHTIYKNILTHHVQRGSLHTRFNISSNIASKEDRHISDSRSPRTPYPKGIIAYYTQKSLHASHPNRIITY